MKTFNLEEFNKQYLKLSDDTQDALKELSLLTGKDVIFRVIDKTEGVGHFKLKIKLARNFMENHIIIINEDMIKDKNDLHYYIVHEVMHGLRVFNAEPTERTVLSFDNANLEILIDEVVKTMNKVVLNNMDDYIVNNYCNELITNINMMLYNSSIDARIELQIYNKYPNLRKLQKKVQKEYIKELQAGFTNEKVIKYTPTWILDRANLLNYCYLTKVTPIIGKSWTSKVNGKIDEKFKEKVAELMFYLDKEDKGQISDNETILEWSKILGMDKYTKLRDFESVNYDYLASN